MPPKPTNPLKAEKIIKRILIKQNAFAFPRFSLEFIDYTLKASV